MYVCGSIILQNPVSVASLQWAQDVGSKTNDPSLQYIISAHSHIRNQILKLGLLTDNVEETEEHSENTPHHPKVLSTSGGGHGNDDNNDEHPSQSFLLEALVD